MKNINRKYLLAGLFFTVTNLVTWSAFAEAKPAADVTGLWKIKSEVIMASEGCNNQIGQTNIFNLAIKQKDKELLAVSGGGNMAGSIKGRNITITGNFLTPVGRAFKNTLTGKLTKKCDMFRGISDWRWSNLANICIGMLEFTAAPYEDMKCKEYEKSTWQKIKDKTRSVLGI